MRVSTMSGTAFDEPAAEYDSWFLKNVNILGSEVLLLAGFLKDPGRALSVGCGSGLFEKILREEHGIDIRYGVEPAGAMAEIAVKRGMEVETGTAEDLPYEDASFDTAILNGCPSYIEDLQGAFAEAWRVLKPGGHIVVADVPAESSFGLLYQLSAQIGSWDDPRIQAVAPAVACLRIPALREGASTWGWWLGGPAGSSGGMWTHASTAGSLAALRAGHHSSKPREVTVAARGSAPIPGCTTNPWPPRFPRAS